MEEGPRAYESWAGREAGGQARPLEVDEEPRGVSLGPHSALWALFLQKTADSSDSVRDSPGSNPGPCGTVCVY